MHGNSHVAAFFRKLIATCDLATLSKQWSVDMAIIGAWEGGETDMPNRDQGGPAFNLGDEQHQPQLCPKSNVSFPVRRPRLRTINLDAGLQAGGWRLPVGWPVPAAWLSTLGNVGVSCPQAPPKGKGCPASDDSLLRPPKNCSDEARRGFGDRFEPRMAPLSHPSKGPQLVREMYSLLHGDNALCTPFVRDDCNGLAPYHAAHYSGRFKHYYGMGFRAGGSSCTCIRTWNWTMPQGFMGSARLVSHPPHPSRSTLRPDWITQGEGATPTHEPRVRSTPLPAKTQNRAIKGGKA